MTRSAGGTLSPARARALLRAARRRAQPPGSPLGRVRTLWQVAHRTFQDADKAERFLIAPHPMLGMQPPLQSAMHSDIGLAHAIAVIQRLVQGAAG